MYDNINPALLLFDEPVPIHNKVNIIIPKVKDVISSSEYNVYARLFTLMNRELFVLERNIDALEMRFPTIWEFIWDEEADSTFAQLFGRTPGTTFTRLVLDGISYWTGLKVDDVDENGETMGFVKLTNGKLMHVGSEWIIDKEEFINFCNLIRYITAWKEPEVLAPKITSDGKHKRWVNHYKNLKKYENRHSTTWADRILSLSIASGSYISPKQISDMTIFEFNHISNALIYKEGFDNEVDIFVSPKFGAPEGTKPQFPKNWRSKFNTGYNKLVTNKDDGKKY